MDAVFCLQQCLQDMIVMAIPSCFSQNLCIRVIQHNLVTIIGGILVIVGLGHGQRAQRSITCHFYICMALAPNNIKQEWVELRNGSEIS